MKHLAALALLLAAPLAGAAERPSLQYPGLYERVQLQRLFADSKTFADSVPRMAPAIPAAV